MIGVTVPLRSPLRLEIDQEAAAVERDVAAVHADEGGEARDIRILEDRRAQRLLAIGHRRVGNGLRGLRDALDQPGVLRGKKPLGIRI
jgi:hypothetical protein